MARIESKMRKARSNRPKRGPRSQSRRRGLVSHKPMIESADRPVWDEPPWLD